MDLVERLTKSSLPPPSFLLLFLSPPTHPILLLPPQLGLILTDSTEVLTLTPPLLKLPNKYVAQWLITGLAHRSRMFLNVTVSPLHVCVCVSHSASQPLCVCVCVLVLFFLFMFNIHMWRPLHMALTPGILTCCWITPHVRVCIHSCLIDELHFCFENNEVCSITLKGWDTSN